MAGPAASLGYASVADYGKNNTPKDTVSDFGDCKVVTLPSSDGHINRYQLLCADGHSNWMNYNITMRDHHGKKTHDTSPVKAMSAAVSSLIKID